MRRWCDSIRFFLLVPFVFGATFHQSSACAQEVFPSRPLTIVVSFPPGGVVDIHARAFGASLERILKQPAAVVNKTGAAGAVGIQFVAVNKPDGYTLLMTTNSMTILPEVSHVLGHPPAFTREQFTPLGLLSADPPVLVVRSDSPWKSVGEMISDAKREPGRIAFGSAGVYSTKHVAMHLLAMAAGIQLTHIPYGGSPPAVMAVLGGHVKMAAAPISVVLPQIQAGTLRALGTYGDRRLSKLPDIPTLRESGLNVEFYQWVGVFAPKQTPPWIMQKLLDALRQAAEMSETKQALAKAGIEPRYIEGEKFQVMLDQDSRVMATAIKTIGTVEPR